uniref:Cullin domain-containing protein n=1 Tax=Heterorhabditis bacteriophora TaxID=37862 RepID=A0A1I7W6P1_HETBA
MGAIPKKNTSTLSPSCMDTLHASIVLSSNLAAILSDLGCQPILAQIYERLAVIEQEVPIISHLLREIALDTMHCIFYNRNSHTTDHCILNIQRKYQVLGEKQLFSKYLKSYTDFRTMYFQLVEFYIMRMSPDDVKGEVDNQMTRLVMPY